MFKLLTEEGGRKVAREYAVRRAICLLLALVLVLTVGNIGLLPSYVLSNARQNEALERTRIMSNSEEGGSDASLQVWLGETNHKLQVLSPALDTDRPSDFIKTILDQKAAGITITGFLWVRAKDKIALSVNGVAASRQSLVTFENRINSSKYFSEVALPISNLAKDRDIDFQIKFSP